MIHQPSGAAYWRSLDELAQTPEFREALKQEFQDYDPDEIASMSRRGFLQIMAASLSLAGVTLAGCRRLPEEKLAPFANRPDGFVPGTTTQYASMIEQAGVAYGTLVTAFDGRPIKVEGNPMHPYSLGATDVFGQASVLEMYDPERARWIYRRDDEGATPVRDGWDAFRAAMQQRLSGAEGGRVAVLSGYSSSPSLDRMKARLLESLPDARWYTWEPVNRDLEIQGTRMALGQDLRPQYDLSKADVIACFDADLLGLHPAALRFARQWSDRRRTVDSADGRMNRLYVAESSFTTTGGVADERLPVRRAAIPTVLLALARELGVSNASVDAALPESGIISTQRFVKALAADLKAARGRSIVAVGPSQPAAIHALAWAINQHLGNLGQQGTITFTPELLPGDCLQEITDLSLALGRGEVDTLLILGGNPAYDAPADLEFGAKLQRARQVAYLSTYTTETSAYATWNLPMAHPLESWSDGRAWDGTYTVQQPLIQPMYDGKTSAELLALLLGDEAQGGYDIVRETFAELGYAPRTGFERPWRQALHDGLASDSGYETARATVSGAAASAVRSLPTAEALELTFHASRNVYDGRFANNAWLQELPEAFTKLTWDNVALINIADARKLEIEQGELLTVRIGEREMRMPAYLMPGQARGSIAVWLGYGREAVGPNTLNIGHDVGFNAYRVRTTGRMWHAPDVGLLRTGETHELALTQNHHLLDQVGQDMARDRVGQLDDGHTVAGAGAGNYSGRIVKDATLEYFRKDPEFVLKGDHFGAIPLQLWEPPKQGPNGETWPEPEGGWDRKGAPSVFNAPHAWGMSVDMNTCIGCNACVVACQAENNIPVVGKQQVQRSREMHWIRIDRYFKTDAAHDVQAEAPQIAHMPVMCQHCENAPCEQVCPVAATVHDTEGLNTMVYNRCIGTRYCSNNCPYKVRRFNYFDYHSKPLTGPVAAIPGIQAKPWMDFPDTQQRQSVNEIKRMVFNPDVTVRMRGVMEKCTYCTQRIAKAKIDAKVAWNRTVSGQSIESERRDEPNVLDGEIQTACQQVCPTQAITFGNLNDMQSKVSAEQMKPRSYGILTELNTRPRTKYLAKIRNPKTERYEV